MVSPTRRREEVTQVQEVQDLPKRRVCRILNQPRSTQRYEPRELDRDRLLVKQMHELVRQDPRYGYRRVWAMLRADGQEREPQEGVSSLTEGRFQGDSKAA